MTQRSLESIRVGSAELRNRVAFAATVNNLGSNRELSAAQIAFYAERARGGVGVVVTEGLSVHPTSIPNPTVPLAYEPGLVGDFARLATAVHDEGAAILGQLWHVGRQALWNPSLQPWSPSGERDPYSGSTPHVMSEAEIFEAVGGFATAAVNLERAGFDGVELHGAHGYLLTQFLSPWSNRRDDRWGGSVENRARIVVEIVHAIRRVVGREFVVGLKISAHEYVEGGLDLEGARELVAHLAAHAAPDYLAVSQANFSPSLEYHVPDIRFEDAPFASLARGIREVSGGIPVMALAKIPDLAVADRLLEEGVADMVGMSRALLADAHLVGKASTGERPRPCIYCNVCWEYIHTGRAVACIYAPETGRESEVPEEGRTGSGEDMRRFHVVGAGPAGLEFARVAARAGHEVHVHERDEEVGGRLAREARIPGRKPVRAAIDWLEKAVSEAGGEISVGDEVTAERLAGWTDDVVVLAAGAEPVVEPLSGIDSVMSLEMACEAPGDLAGPIVIVDEIESEPVYAAAEYLAAAGHEVTIVTRRAAIGRRVAYVSLIGVLRRLDEAGIDIHPLLVPVRVDGGELVASHVFSRREHRVGPVGTVVRAGPYRARMLDGVDGVLTIGDASAPREVLAVVREANEAALAAAQPHAAAAHAYANDLGGDAA